MGYWSYTVYSIGWLSSILVGTYKYGSLLFLSFWHFLRFYYRFFFIFLQNLRQINFKSLFDLLEKSFSGRCPVGFETNQKMT